jgi:hypothetical protein
VFFGNSCLRQTLTGMTKEPVKPSKAPPEEPNEPVPVENPPQQDPDGDRPLVDPVPPDGDQPRM